MTTVIQAEKLSKRYRIGEHERYIALRDVLTRAVTSPLSFLRRSHRETFWALKEASLDVREGEVLGLIGRNGAGKTTLLKILSRITRPTSGWAEIRGRVGSLLEVGTGFHPELTGRENTLLSGAILGMSKREISGKFDEIVAFAELEKFIDTPVKHYSTGMYVRLAFAVAAHLEPEILLVDEVLAVGDVNFQKKCLGKMGDVARAGRTVVLVSHQLNQIRRLCQRVLWIDSGYVRQNGPTHEVTSAYESAMARGEQNLSPQHRGSGTKARFLNWDIVDRPSDPHTLSTLGHVVIKFVLEVNREVVNGHHGIALYSSDGQLIWGNATDSLRLRPGMHDLCYTFPYLPLRPGSYFWRVFLLHGDELIDAWDCLPEMIVATEPLGHPRDEWAGVVNLPVEFNVASKDTQLT